MDFVTLVDSVPWAFQLFGRKPHLFYGGLRRFTIGIELVRSSWVVDLVEDAIADPNINAGIAVGVLSPEHHLELAIAEAFLRIHKEPDSFAVRLGFQA